jgi:pimeloyl-ACP methyl ester carboxylesterase
MHWVTGRGGVPIATYDLGGVGPDLLMAHATGFHGRTWQPVADRLASRFRCVAFDERAHGSSGVAEDESFDWHELAHDVLTVVDGRGLDRPYGVGHSCGGALLLLAEEARPGTFRGLYCFEPIVAATDDPAPADPDRPLAVRARKRRDVFSSRDEALAYLAERPAFRSFDPAALRSYVEHGLEDTGGGAVRLTCRPEHEAAYYEHGLAHHAFRHLDRVECPVTLACGERTDAVGPDTLNLMSARLAHARVEVRPGLGHFGPLEEPAGVAASVERALASSLRQT